MVNVTDESSTPVQQDLAQFGTLLVANLPADAAIAARRELTKDSSLIREQDTPERLIEPGTHPSLTPCYCSTFKSMAMVKAPPTAELHSFEPQLAKLCCTSTAEQVPLTTERLLKTEDCSPLQLGVQPVHVDLHSATTEATCCNAWRAYHSPS